VPDIDIKYVICNGEPSYEGTLKPFQDSGYVIIFTGKAKKFHPYAMDTDTIVFAARPINKEQLDDFMRWMKNIDMA